MYESSGTPQQDSHLYVNLILSKETPRTGLMAANVSAYQLGAQQQVCGMLILEMECGSDYRHKIERAIRLRVEQR